MSAATMTSKGQITIPLDVRKALGLQTGSRVAFVPTDAGTYELVPENRTIKALKGIVNRPGGAVSLEQMEEAISQGAGEGMNR